MELGTFYAVFTRFWGFDPLTWNIKRTFMLKARFEMVHVNQNKIRILWWFRHLTWNIHERPVITHYLQPVVWTFNMVHVQQKRRCSILHVLVVWTMWPGTFQGWPSICKYLQHGFILLDFEALESNKFTEKRSVGKFGSLSFGFPNSPRFVGEKRRRRKMFHVNRLLSPNSLWKLRFFPNLQGAWNFRKGICPFMRPKPKLLHSQGHPCRNRRLGFSGSSPKLWFLHFWAQNCGSKGGPLSETQKSNFWVGASYWNWSVLNGWVFPGKLGTIVDRKNCLHFVVVQNVPC